MTSSTLKIIACLTMLVDHTGAILYPNEIIFRIIGRLAFPIFAFLLVEGYIHTRDVKKYLFRLGIFALISEVPFDIAFHSVKFIEFQSQNVFITLFIALLAITLYEKAKNIGVIFAIFLVALFALVNEFLRADYGLYGVLIIFGFYKFKDNKMNLVFWVLFINLLMSAQYASFAGRFTFRGMLQLFEVFSFVLIFAYNGKKGLNLKYLFYIFYPGHLLILHWISTMV
ncbi:MAG: hypothetical protein H7X94_04285 [Vallitaleaceae bacterium]|nr:hypothetical protein [Vallitaleaceae bacterium]